MFLISSLNNCAVPNVHLSLTIAEIRKSSTSVVTDGLRSSERMTLMLTHCTQSHNPPFFRHEYSKKMFIHIALDTILEVAHQAENKLQTTAKQVHDIDLLVSHTLRSSHQLLKISTYNIKLYNQPIYHEPLWLLLSRNHSPSQLRLSQSSAEVNNLKVDRENYCKNH